MVTFDGTLHSTDGLSMLAVAENLVKHGRFDTRQLEDWENVAVGLDGRPYAKYALGPTLMMLPFVGLALLWPGVGVSQLTLILMPLSSAGAAGYIYLISRRLGYQPKIGLFVALLGGLATMAWPRTRDLVADPLMLLSFTAAFYHALAYRQEGSASQAVFLGIALSLIILHKLINLVTIPLFLGYVSLAQINLLKGQLKIDWRALWLVGWLSLSGLLLTGGYNFYRFGSFMETGYEAGFTTPFWVGLLGQLISPYKSLFLYLPLFILIPFSLPKSWHKHPAETILLVTLYLSQLMAYASWHDWGGGGTWGPRFLVPFNMLWLLLLLPLLEQALQPGQRLVKFGLISLSIASILVQILAISARDNVYLGAGNYWTPPPALSLWGELSWVKPEQWPIWGHLLAFDLTAIPVIWRWQWHKVSHFDEVSLLLTLLIVGLGLAGLWLVYRRNLGSAAWPVSAWLIALGCVALILTRSYGDPRAIERPQEADEVWPGYQALVAQLPQLVQPDEAIIFTDHRFEFYLLDTDKSAGQRYVLAKPTQPVILETVPKLLQQDQPRRVWLVTDDLDNRLMAYSVELWLRERAHPVEDHLFGDSIQLVGFEVNSKTAWEPIPPQPRLGGLVEPEDYTFKGFASLLGWRWPSLDLNQPPILQPGQTYPFELYWIYRGKAPEDDFFARVLDQTGRVVAQTFTTPRLDSPLSSGQLVIEDARLILPENLVPGIYHLQIGLTTPAVVAGELIFPLTDEISKIQLKGLNGP
jgi:hypothetical protein